MFANISLFFHMKVEGSKKVVHVDTLFTNMYLWNERIEYLFKLYRWPKLNARNVKVMSVVCIASHNFFATTHRELVCSTSTTLTYKLSTKNDCDLCWSHLLSKAQKADNQHKHKQKEADSTTFSPLTDTPFGKLSDLLNACLCATTQNCEIDNTNLRGKIDWSLCNNQFQSPFLSLHPTEDKKAILGRLGKCLLCSTSSLSTSPPKQREENTTTGGRQLKHGWQRFKSVFAQLKPSTLRSKMVCFAAHFTRRPFFEH